MSAVSSILIDPAPRLAPEPAEMLARLDGADHLVTIKHWATPDFALVEILDGDRRGERVFAPREAFREDTATLPKPGATGFPWFTEGA